MRTLGLVLGTLTLGWLAACGGADEGSDTSNATTDGTSSGASGSTSSSSSSSSGASGSTSSSSSSSSGSSGGPTCSDGMKNGDETDVDCGGSCTTDCALGKTCKADADCTTGACDTTCIAKPTLTGVLPSCGPASGGSAVTLLGTGLVDKAGWTVSFGAKAATATFGSATSLSATVPAGTAGKVPVSIAGMPGGTLTLNDAFTYVSAATAPTFASPTTSGYSGSYAVAVLDVNGDGKLDYIQDHANSHLDLMINNGNGSFSLTSNGATRASIRRMVVADFDGNGKPDLALTAQNTVGVSLNSGTNLGTRADSTGNTAPDGIVAVDLTGDTKPDLVVIDDAADVVSVFVNKGDGTFNAKVDYTAPRGAQVAAADFDGDGKMDVVASSSQTNAVTVLRGNGDGTLKPAVSFALAAPSAGLAVADFDMNGKADIVVANAGHVSVLFGKGDGTFFDHLDTTIPNANGALVLRAYDFDGNGSPDLAVLNQGTGQVEIWQSLCSGTFTYSGVFFSAVGGYDVAIADLSGDGKMDVLYTATGYQPRLAVRQ